MTDEATFTQLKDTIRRFVRERLVPLEDQVDRDDKLPDDLVEEMKEMGLFGISVPEEYGGLGLSMAEEVEIARELSWTTPVFRSVFGTNIGIGSQGIVMDGTEEQKQTYLPRLATGELIGSFALTEPEAGSDAASLKTRAEMDGNEYVINGTKRFITNAPRANIFTLMARTNQDEPGARGISAFIVERDNPGISIGKPERKMGQHGNHVADVIFEDCRVPATSIIGGEPGLGFKTAMKVLDRGRIHISAVAVGNSERLIHMALSYAMERKQFGKPIADFQLIQAMLADSRTEMEAAKAMVRDAAAKKDAGENVATLAACCKLFTTEMVGRIADRAVQIHGGAGYIADYGVERFYRDVRLYRIYEGTSQIQQLIIARNMIREAEEAG